MEYFTYEMDVFKFERISHYDLYFKPSVPPMPDFFPIRCGAHFFLGSFIRCLARAERLRLQQGRTALFLATGDRQPGGHGNAAVCRKFAEEVHDLSNGAMRIQVYANSTLGGDRDLLETCADGDIPFVVQNTAPQVSFMKDLAVLDNNIVFFRKFLDIV